MWKFAAIVILPMLAEAMKGLVGRVLIALGIGFVTATGFHALLAGVISSANLTGVPAQTYAVFSTCGIPWLISTMVAAITTRLTLRGLTSDALSFFVMRRGLPGV